MQRETSVVSIKTPSSALKDLVKVISKKPAIQLDVNETAT